MPWVEQEGERDQEFIAFIENYRQESRPAVLELLKRYPEKQQFIFESREETDAFLSALRAKSKETEHTTYAAIVQIPDWDRPIRFVVRAETPDAAKMQVLDRLRPDFGDAADSAAIEILPILDAIH